MDDSDYYYDIISKAVCLHRHYTRHQIDKFDIITMHHHRCIISDTVDTVQSDIPVTSVDGRGKWFIIRIRGQKYRESPKGSR